MNTSKEYARLLQGSKKFEDWGNPEAAIDYLKLSIKVEPDLKKRRELAEIVLYFMEKNGLPKENEDFQEIAKLIESSKAEKLSKGIRSRLGLKDKVGFEEATIQKLFKQYEPGKYTLEMLIRRLQVKAHVFIPPKPPERKIGPAVDASAVREGQVMPPELSAVAGAGEPTPSKAAQAHPPVPPVRKTGLAVDASAVREEQVMPPEPSAVAGAGEPSTPKASQANPPAPPGAPRPNIVGSPPKPPGAIGAPKAPAPPGGRVPMAPRPPSAVSLEEKDGQAVDALQEQISKLKRSDAPKEAKIPGKPTNPMLEELQKRLKGRGGDTGEYEFVGIAPAKEASPPTVAAPRARTTERKPRSATGAPEVVLPKVSFFEQTKNVKLRSTAEAKGDKVDAPPKSTASSELEERLRRRREQSEKESESKHGPSKN